MGTYSFIPAPLVIVGAFSIQVLVVVPAVMCMLTVIPTDNASVIEKVDVSVT